ncbi:hypothetical protein PYW07_003649 [Mythimna separata]|uniref:Integrin alpha second immunoglobulin-like domain-containing protein n=1 Tax=Mythimna separata TaxID=271217 RepID=A0AAD7YPD0_MYTSE|nr:hypothetical protein PYW07_003649 [Mythimna separata]
MRSLIWVCLAVATWSAAFALYYETKKQIFQPPTSLRNNSYFGYSITYDGSMKRLVVSAPRSDNIGDVYDCSIDKNSCNVIDKSVIVRGREIENYTHDFWLGATVKAGPDFVMMCAPRHTEHTVRFNAFVARGMCYTHRGNTLTKRKQIEEPIRISDADSKMETTMDSFGWSIDVASDDTIIVGGPGMFHGRAMIYNQQEHRTPDLIRYGANIPQFNFGYAVASGKFINRLTSYAISSTYRFGEVLFYRNYKQYQKKLKNNFNTVGTMFGAVLCAAKMLGDRTDLLVGAPAYGQKENYAYNLGAVHVYLAKTLNSVPTYKRTIVGENSGSMFGSAIINVLDINNDGKEDIAIGAPFENSGQGVVYLYSGADIISDLTAKALKPLQKIYPEASYGESFGMSLTSLLDYDDNGCYELAIGSPYTNTVVLLQCIASVTVNTTAKFDMDKFQNRTFSRKEDFDFEVCLTVFYPTKPDKVTASIKTTVEMVHENAKLADPSGRYIFETSLETKQRDYCKTVPFKLPLDGKYDTEIQYMISSKLLEDPRNASTFDPSRVLLSDRSVLSIQGSLWVAECSGSKVCVPKLEFTPYISFKNDFKPYTIGSSLTETMSVTVTNSGDVAYASCVRIHIVGTNIFKPANCMYEASSGGDQLRCEPSKPLWNGDSTDTGLIELEMTHLTNEHDSINITIFLYNRCNEAATENRTITIPVKADPSGITAKGETDVGDVVDMTEEDLKDNGKYFRHVYKIQNNGPTNWKELDVLVTLQLHPFVNYISNENASVRLYSYPSNTNTPCTSHIETEKTKSYICKINSLIKKVEYSQVLIPIYILPKTLEEMVTKEKNVTLSSSIKMEITAGVVRPESVTTTLVLKEATVPLETIIISVIVGLCILIIIAVVLYRVGFLRRKRKEELEKLRKSVKRQTILRRSTMPSQGHASEDRRQILEGMKEEDEHEQAPNLI